MSRGIYVALSGAVAQEAALETTAQNLANASTAGYQRQRPIFREVLAGAQRGGAGGMHYAAADGTALDGARGTVRATSRGLDVALPEGVYLAATTPRGERYTRQGALQVSADGSLTAAGAKLIKEDGEPIKLAPGVETTIGADGSVLQSGATVAKLKLVKGEVGTTFAHQGDGLLVAGGPAPVATAATIDVGSLEDSNASVIGSMTELVTASRTFEAFQKMLETMGEADRKVLTTVPGPTE